MTFKEKLVRLRKLKGLTQDEFANAVGVSRQAVYKWELGRCFPSADNLMALAELYEVHPAELLVRNDIVQRRNERCCC